MSLLLLPAGLLLLFLLLIGDTSGYPEAVVLRVHVLVEEAPDEEVAADGLEEVQGLRGDGRNAVQVQVLQSWGRFYDVLDGVLGQEFTLAQFEVL